MVDPQTSRFWQAALQSRLVDDAELTACWESLPPEKRVPDQLDRRLARQALQSGLLTLWQAQQLLAGRSTGFKIDRYVLLNMIGQGGMGRVYLAKDSRLNRQVALKILSPERVNNPRAIARFQREARVGAQLQHENLVRIYDEGESDGKCYLVMEFIAGKTIGAMIAEHGPLAPSTAAKLTQQIAMGLEHAQQKGLIHRDVNPYNIMVTSDGTAKLADLGLAIDLSEDAAVTRDGATVGTFDYISPEQARHSHSVDTRSDIYSLGCTLYHMLTGQVPYPCPSLPEKLFGHQAVDPEPIATLAPNTPEGLIEVVRTMMRKRPDDRYATPRDLARALEPFTTESADAPRAGGGAPAPAPAFPAPAVTTSHSSTRIALSRREPVVEAAPPPPPPPPPATPPQDVAPPIPDVRPTTAPHAPDKLLEGLVDFGPKRNPSGAAPASTATPAPTPTTTPTRQNQGQAVAPAPAPAPAAPGAAGMPELDLSRIGQERTPRKDDLSGLGLDLGPEPSLSEVASKPRAKPAPAPPSPKSESAASRPSGGSAEPVPAARRGRGRRLVAAAAALIIAAAGGLWATGMLGKTGLGGHLRPNHAGRPSQDAGSKVVATPKASPDDEGDDDALSKPRPESKPKTDEAKTAGVTVRASDGTTSVEPNLKAAMQRAIGSRGHVLLDNREPLRLSGADAKIKVNGGPLYIRAAEGVQPVIQVEINGTQPFLTTGAQCPVTLVGVTIEAHFAQTGPSASPPVLEAAGKVSLDRCAFKATGHTDESRAVSVLGGSLDATGSWFDGFDQALDVAAFGGSTVTLKQCLFVKTKSDDAPPGGWALRVRNRPGGAAKLGRQLKADHCTVVGQGLFDLGGFSPQTPYKVEINACAVLADMLLAWQSQPPGLPLSNSALQWQGRENQYDVRGQAWVVLAPQAGIEMPGGPTNLETWKSLVGESDSFPPPVKLQTNPAERSTSASLSPRDFLVLDVDPPIGADPDHVGPGAKPSRPKL